MANEYVKYEHHGKVVTVKKENKGKHRENCLCFDCAQYLGCHISERVYSTCALFGIVTPVWECPAFKQK